MTFTTLIVDDDIAKQEMLKRELIANGITASNIFIVSDAAAARKILGERSFDLLLLDLILPPRGGDNRCSADVGLELLRQMVEDIDLPAPSNIVGITASREAMQNAEEEFRRLTTQILLVTPESKEWKQSLRLLILRLNTTNSITYDYDVCFITALRTPELDAIVALPCNWQPEESLGNGILVRKGLITIHGAERRVLCAHSNQMGPVAATFLSQQLIQIFRPRLLLMTGICGGIGEKPKLGDVIVAVRSWDWQSGKWLEDKTFEAAPDQKEGCSELVALALGAEDELINLHQKYIGNRPPKVPALLDGPMVSGSAVVADPDLHEMLKLGHRKAIAVDMECFGVYFSANMSSTPTPKVLCIKAVSDLANRQKSDDFQEYCSYVSAQVAFFVVKKYFSNFI